jgi:signal transduction histidine kinase
MVQERTRELNEALQKEKELVDLKTKFVAMASHEFRTPLSTISLATGFLRRYKDRIAGEEIDRKLDDIVRQIEHMNYLLEDVLTVGKTEAGKVNVNVQVIEVERFFEVLAREVYQSSEKTHRIRLSVACDHAVIATDPRMLRIIVVNLLTNAIKFSPGQPSVGLHVTDTNRTLRVQVSDAGIGIPDDDRESLFNSFHRGSNTLAIQGTGLGLSIVRKTVDLLGGSIHVESSVNQGTTFIIAIPLHENKDDISH